jgi:DNA-binding PadR family transcriptional regulator
MTQLLVLYYLNIKSTHGYEIQKFIQTNHMDKWTKIQSGSIYYALSKLEKKGCIEVDSIEGVGPKSRKIYSITELGKKELEAQVKESLKKSIYPIGSDKFLIYSMLGKVSKEQIKAAIYDQIEQLKKHLEYIESWRQIKCDENVMKIERASFDIMINNILGQIKWHESLDEELDECLKIGEEVENLIKDIDYTKTDDRDLSTRETIEHLKKEILTNPEQAEQKLDKLIDTLKQKK